jgi:L-alanine-DL-glutamate epimerase-like enolase superfamily enzyme
MGDNSDGSARGLEPATHWHSFQDTQKYRPSERQYEISSVEAIRLEGKKDWGLIQITTDSGLTGIGETFPTESSILLAEQYGTELLGENPLDVSRLVSVLPSLGRTEAAAVAGLEIALWDLKGKILDVPVYELFGGAYRNRIPVYADLHAGVPLHEATDYDTEYVYDPSAYAKAAKSAVKDGFEILKFDLDVPRRSDTDPTTRHLDNRAIDRRADVLTAVRDAVGTETEIAVDLHRAFSRETALRLGHRVESHDLSWIEDPVPPAQLTAHTRINKELDTPVLTGESLSSPTEFDRFISNSAMDIAAPDITNCGGLARFREIASICNRAGIGIAPHNTATPIGTVATAHAAATVQNVIAVEYHGIGVPWWDDIVDRTTRDGPIVENGHILLPEGPGLGVSLNEDVVSQHEKE